MICLEGHEDLPWDGYAKDTNNILTPCEPQACRQK